MTIRAHNSCKQIKRFRSKRKQKIDWKPEGLWYGVDRDWERWCEAEKMDWIGRYEYQLQIDESKILVLSSAKELFQFTKEFGVEPPYSYGSDPAQFKYLWIDWPAVAKKWHGIEIAPYIWECRHKLMWYYGWDCASGCIWDVKAIKSSVEITRTEHGVGRG